MAAPKRDTKSGRQALLVLGMHRSGTSAVSGVLTHLGAQAPRTLMPPTKDNPRGYWESVELMRLHDQVLSSAGSRWNDWGEFNPEWIDSSLARDLSRLLVESISKEYDRAPLFVVKDPRICRFVPLWLVALRGARITPKVIIPVRHPLDVARSLELRDHFGRSRSMLLWLRHVLDAEASSRSVARTFVLYENLLDDWRAQARKIATQLDLVWPKWSGDTEAKIEDFLTEELRHHAARNARIPGDGKLSEWIGTVYRILLEADEKPLDQAALAVLDAIRDEFNQTSGMYAAVVREHQTRVEGLHAEMKSQLSKKTLEYDGLATKQRELLQEVAAGEKALAERVDEVKTLSGSLEAGSAERAEILRQQELDDARRELLEETKAQLAQSTAEALNLKLGATHEALAQAERMLEEQRALAHGAVARLKSCEEEYSRSTADLERQVRDHALQLQASKAEHSEAEDRLKERVESLTTELTDGQGELVRVKAQLEALGQQFQASKAEQSEAEDRFKARVESLTTELTDGQGELVRVKTQLEALGQQLQASKAEQSEAEDRFKARVESLTAKLTDSQRELVLANAQVAALGEQFQARMDEEIGHLRSQSAAAGDELASRQAQVAAEHQAQREVLARQIESLRAGHDGLKAKLEQSTAELEREEAQRVQAVKAIEAMEVSVQQRYKETAKLTQMVFALEQSDIEWAGREREHLQEIAKLADREREHLQEIAKLADREREHLQEMAKLAGRERKHLQEIAKLADREREHQELAHENLRQFTLLEYDKALMHAQKQSLLEAMDRQESTTIRQRLIDKFGRTQPGRLLRIGSDSTKYEEIAPSSADFGRNVEMLRSSAFFESPWYLAQYPDVREQEADPVHHYLLYGAREGRNPGPCFDTVDYLIRYSDVRHSALNPLVHYLEYGQEEGREATPPKVEH